jgi:hypothetical protein
LSQVVLTLLATAAIAYHSFQIKQPFSWGFCCLSSTAIVMKMLLDRAEWIPHGRLSWGSDFQDLPSCHSCSGPILAGNQGSFPDCYGPWSNPPASSSLSFSAHDGWSNVLHQIVHSKP